MDLDRMSFEVRARSHWEAIDLGFMLARANARALWVTWFAITLPLVLLINALAWWAGAIWAGALALWWLKPLLDRVLLYVLSRSVFGATPSLRRTLRDLPGGLWRGLGPALLLERLDLARSFDLPVAQLEGQRWMARARRQKVLQSSARGAAVWLTVVCSNVEAMLGLGVWLVALMFVPFEFLPESAKAIWATFVQSGSPWAMLVLNAIHYLTVSVVEPFYVAGGFSLYLNRRTQLEAWDLELAFRRLVARVEGPARIAAALVLAAGLALALPTPSATAAEPEPVPELVFEPELFDVTALPEPAVATGGVVLAAPPAQYATASPMRAALERTYATDPNLKSEPAVGSWKRKHPAEASTSEPMPAWLENLLLMLGSIVAGLSRFTLWIVVVGALLVAWVTRHQWLPLILDPPAPLAPRTDVRWAGDSPDPLPRDAIAAARAAWHAGRSREALSLLYRDAVRSLARRVDAGLPRGATEAQCLRAARVLPEAERERFARLVRAWQMVAYAGRAPDEAQFVALLPPQAPAVAA